MKCGVGAAESAGGSSLGSDSEISLGGTGTAAGADVASAGFESPNGASGAGGGAAQVLRLELGCRRGAIDSRGRCLGGAIS